MTEEKRIKVKAMCLLMKNGRVLVADGDSIKSTNPAIVPGSFYRAIGGSINFNEMAEEGVRREVREELDSEIENLEHLDIIENRFMYAGMPGHEVAFLFKGTLARKELTERKIIHVVEDNYEFDAVWIPIDDLLQGEKPLYPPTDYARFLKSKS